MEVDIQESKYNLIRQGQYEYNKILPLCKQNLIGRGVDASIIIISLYVSRNHCYIIQDENSGKWFIKDLGSLNGTYINEVKLTPSYDYEIKVGDKIGLGITMIDLSCASYQNSKDYYVYELAYTAEERYDINELCMEISKSKI